MRPVRAAALLLLSCAACHGCNSSSSAHPSTPPGVSLASITVTSKAFPANGDIPVDFTCDGAIRSPALTWSAPPAGTQAFAIEMDDPDAPGGDFTHWLAWNLRGETLAIGENADIGEYGGVVGTNGFNRPGYGGPCPPRGEVHRYYFRVFALDAPIDAKPGSTRDVFDAALAGHVLAEGALMGEFSH